MNKKIKFVSLAVATATLMFGSVSVEAAEVSALVNQGNGYNASTERKVADYLQKNDTAAEESVNVITEEIPFETAYIGTDTLFEGEEVTTQEGVNGVKKVTTVNKIVGGKVVDVVISEEIVTEPVNAVVKIGTKEKTTVVEGQEPIGLDYSRVITMDATAYCPCSICCGKWANGYTATGMKAGYGIAAIDPKTIPYGTKLYVEGYGYCVAGDTGGAIRSDRIDLCHNSHAEALASGFGHKMVKVYILN